MRAATVALVGANGHGLHHRRVLAGLAERGVARLVALADPAPVVDAPGDVPVFGDHRAMLERIRPDVVIVCTPPHTHLDLARDVLRAGSDLLLEKPPVLDRQEHDALVAARDAARRAVQIGFQALASPALGRLRTAIADGALGTVRRVSVVGAWQRDDAYWGRSAWSGRRFLGGRPTLDGALANPFAHAVMQALAVVDAEPVGVEVSWLRVRAIEVEDTATLRVTLADGVRVLVAVTLAGEEFVDGDLTVHGSDGTAELTFRDDLLRLPGGGVEPVPGRITLLENLVQHRRTGVPLLAPPERTAGFTSVIEALRTAPDPVEVVGDAVAVDGGSRVLRGVNDALRRCAADGALLDEVPVPWTATVRAVSATG